MPLHRGFVWKNSALKIRSGHEGPCGRESPPEKRTSALDGVKILSSLYGVQFPSDEAMSALLSAGFQSVTSIAFCNLGRLPHRGLSTSAPPKAGDVDISEGNLWKPATIGYRVYMPSTASND